MAESGTPAVQTGLDRLREGLWKGLRGLRLGLLSNQASLDARLTPAARVISRLLPGQLRALFGPQHGHGGEDQDNMAETGHDHDASLQAPVFSLYADVREPLPHMLEMIDVLLIDIQDVGTRVYTFASTMLGCLRAASRARKKVIVLDRPNPLGGETAEGNRLRQELRSFVGPCSFPMRHGLTMGEMARIFKSEFALEGDLDVIPMSGWRRDLLWPATGLKWLMPSPNMPAWETACVYPGQVIWEGTNLSEGRGTCRPFEIFGAPFFNPSAVLRAVDPAATNGCVLQEYRFRPTFHKWQGELCRGFMIHVTDPLRYKPYFTSLCLLKAALETHGKDFRWKEPPYEYEYRRRPADLIIGDSEVIRGLESGMPVRELEEGWRVELESFMEWRRPYLLYS